MNVLDPAGAQAAHIAGLWWLTVAICAVVFAAVMIALGWAVWRAPRADAASAPEVEPPLAREKRASRAVAGGAAISLALLGWLLVASILTDRALARVEGGDPLAIRVTAHQWWWDVTYDDPQPDRAFNTANELYIPVGRPVVVRLASDDVIHSFWIPSLHGKKDLIPGRTSTISLRADRAGRYVGECAEFCGLQHAFMAFDVVALAPADFEAWAESRRKPAAEPEAEAERRGRELFLSGSCMLCHAIQGTSANARKGPDLTHVASRARIGAGRLPNTRSHLAEWIEDPQRFKPGVNMPAHPLAPADLAALAAYLSTLK